MDSKTIWRGGYGDVCPVEVARESHTLPDVKLLEDHYETEAQAWGGVTMAAEDSVEAALRAHQRALAECSTAGKKLVARRVHYRKTVAAYDDWRRVQAAQLGAAV